MKKEEIYSDFLRERNAEKREAKKREAKSIHPVKKGQ